MAEDKNLNTHPANARNESTSGIRRRVLTRERVESYALASLGFPKVDVEITPQQFGEAWERTLDEYNKWLPLEKHDVITATSATVNQYDLLALNKPFGRMVTDVRIASKEEFFSPISGVFALGIPHPVSHLSPDQYDLALRYIFTAKKIYSSEPDWLWEEPILWIYAPSGFGGPFIAAYRYSQDSIDPGDVPQEDWGWVLDYNYNQVKKMVGEARGKFGVVPGPDSTPIRGAELADAAEEKLTELSQELEAKSYCRVPPLGPGSVG
jgi:hypothetical protein